MNGYYHLTQPNPVVVQFNRERTPSGEKLHHTYHAHIIPLGTYRQGVQAFVERCTCIESGEIVLEGNPDGTVKMMKPNDAFVNAILGNIKPFRRPHFNQPPFANISYSRIDWVQEKDTGLVRWLPYQEKAHRILFNAIFQSTGADHLRWLMNNVDNEICRRDEFQDCNLILTVHDSLLYEVPEAKWQSFVKAAALVLTRRPSWATLDIEIEAEIGRRYGEMNKVNFAIL